MLMWSPGLESCILLKNSYFPFSLFLLKSHYLRPWPHTCHIRYICNESEKYLALFCCCSWDHSNPQVNKNPTTGFPSHTFIYSRLMLCNKSKNTGVTLNNSLGKTIISSQRLVTMSASLCTQTGLHCLILQVLNIKSQCPNCLIQSLLLLYVVI